MLLLCSAIFLLYIIGKNFSVISTPYNPQLFQHKFEVSQWRVPNSTHPISDDELYAYSGYELVHGLNPILVSPEVPPLGKYMIGVSILLTNNHHLVSLFLALASLCLIFYFIYFTTKSFVASAFAVFLTSINTIFYDQIIHAPQIDISQLFFLLLIFIFYTHYERNKKILFLLLTGIAIGCFISIKVTVLSFALINGWLFVYYVTRRYPIVKIIKDFAILNAISLLTYTITYASYFLHGGTLKGYLGVQKWIFTFYSSSPIETKKLIGNYLMLTFFNRWRFWSPGYPSLHYDGWSLLWPIIFIVGAFATIKMLLNKQARTTAPNMLLIMFFLAYNVFLFVVPIFPRYLLLLFVPLNLIIVLYLASIKTQRIYGKRA